jgi:hypothetical protein
VAEFDDMEDADMIAADSARAEMALARCREEKTRRVLELKARIAELEDVLRCLVEELDEVPQGWHGIRKMTQDRANQAVRRFPSAEDVEREALRSAIQAGIEEVERG